MFNNIDFLVIFLVIGWGNTYEKSVLLLDVDYTVINTDSMIDFFIYYFKK